MKNDDSTIFDSDKDLNISIPQSLHLEDMCREITRERGQKNKGRAILFLAPRSRNLAPFTSTIDMDIISLRLDKRNGDLACWPKYFLIFARYFCYLVIQNKTKPKQTYVEFVPIQTAN